MVKTELEMNCNVHMPKSDVTEKKSIQSPKAERRVMGNHAESTYAKQEQGIDNRKIRKMKQHAKE